MKQKVKTIPDLSIDSPLHQAALLAGDDHFRSWQHNVMDELKPLSHQEVKDKLQETSFPYAVCFENLISDFNLASGFRNANAFNAREMFYLGNKKFDRRGLCGTHNYMDIHWLSTIEEFLALRKKYKIIGIDNCPGAISLDSHIWEPDTLVVFGSESVGITPTMQSYCQKIVKINQYGSVRSINVATASGIIMNSIVTQFINK